MALLDPGDRFHVGVIVPDVSRAMDELGPVLGLTWRRRISGRSMISTGGTDEREFAVDAVYSFEGPTYVELIKVHPNSPWEQLGLHHFGYWADDVAASSEQLADAGIPEMATFRRDGLSIAAYHRLPSGVLVELIPRSARERILSDPD